MAPISPMLMEPISATVGQFFFGESQSRLYPHMRAKFGRGPTVVSKKGSLKFISTLHGTNMNDENIKPNLLR